MKRGLTMDRSERSADLEQPCLEVF